MIDDFLLNLLASLAYDLLKALSARFRGERDDLLRDLRQELRHQSQALEALQALLARLGGERVVRVEGNVAGSVIITGDGNAVSVADGGTLAQRWQELQIGDAEAEDLYRKRTAQRYDHLSFPLSGISFHALLDQVYQPLQVAPVRDLTHWPQAERAPLHERCETDDLLREGPVALLGALGGGKTTTLHYLTWAYAWRPEDRLLWREDELIPFQINARDLAQAWQDETEFTAACARAVLRAHHHPLCSPYLTYRVLESALKEGKALLLIDALDEYRAPDVPRRDLLLTLHSLWQEEPFCNNPLLLTSRPHVFLDVGFQAYILQALEHPRAEWLAYRLGKVLLQAQGESESGQQAKLKELTHLVVSPQMQAFASPFYVTLLTLAVCRSSHFADGLRQAQRIGRLADLYRFFLHQTIHWEQSKPDALSVDEDVALRALADLGWQTFAEPPWREQITQDLLSEPDRHSVLSFWQRTGLLQRDAFSGEWVFYHTGFQLFGAALMLNEAWKRGQQEAVRRLHRETSHLTDWETVWQLFFGLRGEEHERFIS